MKLPQRFMDNTLSDKRAPPDWIKRLLHTTAHAQYYPVIVGLISFILTLTFAFPFGCVLILAVLLAPRRWLLLGIITGIASGLAGALLVKGFHTLGHEIIFAKHPEFLLDQRWQFLIPWLEEYSLWALAIIAASPVPQTPFLLIYSLHDPNLIGVFLAISLGKSIKYLFIAWLCAHLPGPWVRLTRNRQ